MSNGTRMPITFRTDLPIAEAMAFEGCLPPSLRISSPERKTQLISNGVAAWISVDGVLAGECYGAPASFAQDPDIAQFASDAACICVFGCEIFDQFRQRGLSKTLFAYWMALCQARGFTSVVGHAAHDAMLVTVQTYGAEVLVERPGWGGIDGTASLFRLTL